MTEIMDRALKIAGGADELRPMNGVIKAEWIAALRSGDYKQGRGALCHEGSYCCLGVLSELFVAKGLLTKEEAPSEGYIKYFVSGKEDGDTAFLPDELRPLLALNHEATQALMSLNDHEKGEQGELENFTFSDIADFIEEAL